MSDVINGVPRELLERIACEVTPKTHQEMFDSAKDFAAAIKELRALLSEQPQASRCSDCGYLTSQREHLGCLRKAVAELDAATGGQPQASAAQSAPAGERDLKGLAEVLNEAADVLEDVGQSAPDVVERCKNWRWPLADELSGFACTLASWQRTQSAGVPDGWKLVPVEPTEEMRRRAQDYLAAEGMIVSDWLIHTSYTEMLAAAPKAPEGRDALANLRAVMAAHDQTPEEFNALAAADAALSAAQGEFNRAHIMDALLMWNRRHEEPPIRVGYEYGVAEAVLDLAAAQDQGEVQRLREALEKAAIHVRPTCKELYDELCSALAASTGQEVKS